MDQDTLRSKLADYRRPAYLPICFRSESGPDRSKFGGVAWVNQGEAWPSCSYCARPLTLLLQLKLSELPMKVAGWPERGFAQVFYCTTQGTCCEQRGEDAFSPFGRFLCARLIEPGQSPAFDRDCPDEACLQAAVV